MLPCTTAVYEVPGDLYVQVRHVSTTKAMRDFGAVTDAKADIEELLTLTGAYMTDVWEQIESSDATVG